MENRTKAGSLAKTLAKLENNAKLAQQKINERAMFEAEQLGLFEVQDITAENEIPTLMARLPIFPATDRSKQQNHLDVDNALPFTTPFGRGRRHGPPVNTDDEDRLFALMRLRTKKLIGRGDQLPVPQSTLINGEENVGVHWVCCTISDIHNELGLTDSGANFKFTRESLKRLNGTVIELETKKEELYFGKSYTGTGFKLIDIIWKNYETEGMIKAQFTPIVANWLENHASYINWEVRKKLKSRNARALHRFLSTQPNHYKRNLKDVAETISWEGESRRMKAGFTKLLNELVDVGWLKDWQFKQERKRMPIMLEVIR